MGQLCSSAPDAPPAAVDAALRDLALGTLVIASLVLVVAYNLMKGQWKQRQAALRRSRSVCELVELDGGRALDACADMMAAFDERQPSSPRHLPLEPSLPTLIEHEAESWQERPSWCDHDECDNHNELHSDTYAELATEELQDLPTGHDAALLEHERTSPLLVLEALPEAAIDGSWKCSSIGAVQAY